MKDKNSRNVSLQLWQCRMCWEAGLAVLWLEDLLLPSRERGRAGPGSPLPHRPRSHRCDLGVRHSPGTPQHLLPPLHSLQPQGVSEAVLGGMTGLAALVGAGSTLLYPLLLARLGLPNTGLLGFILQSSFLALCVASVWAPGSPFSLTSGVPQANTSFIS